MKRFLRFFVVLVVFMFLFGSLNVKAEEINNVVANEEPTTNETQTQINTETEEPVITGTEVPNEIEEEPEEDDLNRRAAVIISKLDDYGNFLPGAVLQILDSDGLVVDEWTSGNESFAILLPNGTYTLHEVSAPEGYIKAEDKTFTVTIKETNVIATTDHDDTYCTHYPTELYYIESEGIKQEVYCVNQGWDEPNDIVYDGMPLTEDNIRSFVPDADDTMTDAELYNKVLDIVYHRTQIEDGYLDLSNSEIRLITEYALKNYTSALYNNGNWARRFAYSEDSETGYIVDPGNGTSLGKLAQHWWTRVPYGHGEKIPKKYADYYNWLVRDEDHHPEDMTLYLYSTNSGSDDSQYQNLLGIRWITPDDAANIVEINLINNKKDIGKTEIVPPITGINNTSSNNSYLLIVLLSMLGFGLRRRFN